MKQRIGLIIFGLVLVVVFLEGGLRLGGWVITRIKGDHRTLSLSNLHEFRILCLGESTTFDAWPKYLEELLNSKVSEQKKFKVINKAKVGTTTAVIASELDAYLDLYQPHMVVAMMGINDTHYTVKYKGTFQDEFLLFLYDFRVYKLARLLWQHLRYTVLIVPPVFASDDTINNHQKEVTISVSSQTEPGAAHQRDGGLKIENTPQELKLLDAAWNYEQQNAFGKAEKAYKEILTNNPENVDALLYLGWFYIKRERYRDAEKMLLKAQDVQPDCAEAYIRLGWCYRNQKQFDKAEEMLRKGLALKTDARNYFEYALCLIYARNIDKALEVLLEAQERFPDNGAIYGEIAACYEKQQNLEMAETYCTKGLERDPDDVTLMFRLAKIKLVQKKYAAIKKLYRRAMVYYPERLNLYSIEFKLFTNLVASCFIMQKKYYQAEVLYREAIKREPSEPSLYAGLGLTYFTMGKERQARKAYAQADNLRITEKAPLRDITAHNYNVVRKKVESHGIRLVCVQYPMRRIALLQDLFKSPSGIIFVDNEKIFKDAVRNSSYHDYFSDNFAVDFGHCTEKGKQLLAENIARIIFDEYFNDDNFKKESL